MKKIRNGNKKQKITGLVILSVLVLGTDGTVLAVHNNNVAKAQAYERYSAFKQMERNAAKIDAKREAKRKAEKEKQASAEIVLNDALVKAENEPTEENIKATEVAIKPVKSTEVVKKAETSLKAVKTRYTLISEAKKAVSEYQKDAMNDSKKITAQNAVAKLKDNKDKSVVTTLTNQVSESTKQADTAKARAEQDQASASGSQSSNSSSQAWTQSNGSTSNANSSSNTGGGSSGSSNQSSGGSSSGGTKSSSYNGAYGNSKEAQDKLNQAEQEASNQEAPSGWMGY